MKLLFKIALSFLSVALLLGIAYLLLPSFLTELARFQLKQQGFNEFEIRSSTIGSSKTDIEWIQLSNDDYRIELNGVHAEYTFADLLRGSATRIHIEALSIHSIRDEARTKTGTLPSPELLSGFLSLAWHDFLPANALNIDQLVYYSEDGTQSLRASVELSKLEKHLQGKVNLVDYRHKPFQAKFEVSPEVGIELQIVSQQTRPLSLSLKPMQGVNGLSGWLHLDLEQLAGMMDRTQVPDGLLQADISYFSNAGSPEIHFSIEAKGTQLALRDTKIDAMQLSLNGQVARQDKVHQIALNSASYIQFHDIQQGQNTLQQLQMGLPEYLSIAGDNIKIAFDSETQITFDDLNMAPLSTPKMRIKNLELIVFSPDENASQACQFKMQLVSPLINIDDQYLKPSPVHIEGYCPERDTQTWSITADSDKIEYQNPDYIVFLHHCQLSIGNSVRGKRLDPDPAELGGELLCNTSQLSDAVNAQFRFNPQNTTGRVNFSIANIAPDDETPLFSSILKDWSQPFEIVSGTLSAKGQYRWWKTSEGEDRENLVVGLDVVSAGGHYEGILFSDLNYGNSIEVLPVLKTSEFSTLSIEHIDIAVPVTRASADIRFSPSSAGSLPLIEIDKMSMSLLNGTLSTHKLKLDLNVDQQNILFSTLGLDLAEIVAMQQLEGLAATGLLDGTVPVTISAKGISITQGKIHARYPGGQIKYIPSSETAHTGQSVPGSDLVLKILENLYYDSLRVDVDYKEDGQLTMELAIQGKSPQVDANRPIHFNLTLEQNLLTLLKGLRYAQGISEDIDHQVQKYYKDKGNALN